MIETKHSTDFGKGIWSNYKGIDRLSASCGKVNRNRSSFRILITRNFCSICLAPRTVRLRPPSIHIRQLASYTCPTLADLMSETFLGWHEIEVAIQPDRRERPCELSHSQIQTLIGALGFEKGYNVWLPPNNRCQMDWSIAKQFIPHKELPSGFKEVRSVRSSNYFSVK